MPTPVREAPRRLTGSRVPWLLFACEFAGPALLVATGVSLVIVDFGAGSSVAAAIPWAALRRVLTGFGFGCVGALIAVSVLGKVSSAHIDPVVTLAFWVKGAIGGRHALGYIAAQLAGGVTGALPLLAWGRLEESVGFGTIVPGASFPYNLGTGDSPWTLRGSSSSCQILPSIPNPRLRSRSSRPTSRTSS